MRKLPAAIILILVAELVVFRRIGLTGPGGFLLIFVTMAGMCVWAAKQEAMADRLRFQKIAASIGFQPVDRDEVTLSTYPLLGEGWVQGAACGELRGLKMWIFDYEIPDRGVHKKSIRQTVVAFDVEGANLPIFQIRPLGLAPCIGDVYWNVDETMCFPDATHFHRRFELISSAEEGTRRHFDAKLLNTIAALNPDSCIVQGYFTTVLVFTYGRALQQLEGMDALARQGADIAYAVFSTEKRVMAAAAGPSGLNS